MNTAIVAIQGRPGEEDLATRLLRVVGSYRRMLSPAKGDESGDAEEAPPEREPRPARSTLDERERRG